MKNGQIKVINGNNFNESIVDVLISVLPVPGSSPSSITFDVQKQNTVRTVGF